jgi:hypothetical protein
MNVLKPFMYDSRTYQPGESVENDAIEESMVTFYKESGYLSDDNVGASDGGDALGVVAPAPGGEAVNVETPEKPETGKRPFARLKEGN